MKLSAFSDMLIEYEIRPIDIDDLEERKKILISHKYSVIFEGNFLEFDNLVLWIKENITADPVIYLFYGKLGYDYGYFELFFNDQNYLDKVTSIIPALFTIYPSGQKSKSNGYDEQIFP